MFSDENDRKIKKTLIKSIIWLITVFVCIYLIIDINADETGLVKNQQYNFSHKIHSGKQQLKCLFCHYSAANSEHSNIPTSYDCMICHIALKNEKESLQPIVQSYYNKTYLKWNRMNQLPDHTHFNHSAHINTGIDCSSCHGKVEEMDSINTITTFTMKWCIDCHNEPSKIIPARDISGIFVDKRDSINSLSFIQNRHSEQSEESSKSVTYEYNGFLTSFEMTFLRQSNSNQKYSNIPFIGGYSYENKKLNKFANTNCSICHH